MQENENKSGATVKPPYSNTGVQITDELKENDKLYSIDWISFTIKSNFESALATLSALQKGLSLTEASPGLGYKKAHKYGLAIIMYDGTEAMGTHVVLSGKAVKQFNLSYSIEPLIMHLKEYNYTIARLDLAMDIYSNYMDIIENAINNKDYSTKSRRIKIIKELEANTNVVKGRTFYIGSRTSNKMLRIYDKGLEQGTDLDWTRFELELKAELAKDVFIKLLDENIRQLINSLLLSTIRFTQGSSTNITRRRTADWYVNLLDKQEVKYKFEVNKHDDLDSKIAWLLAQVSKSLVIADKAISEDKSLLEAIYRQGERKLSLQDEMTIIEYRKQLSEEE